MIGTAIDTIDRLSYTYLPTSNKLASVTDPTRAKTASAKLGDFIDGTNTGNDYFYDGNGNMVADSNKHISSILYNHLNLPSVITIAGKGTITYQYDATGNKLTKTVVDNTGSSPKTTVTDYAGAFVYKQDSLELISHEEGRIRPVYKSGQPIQYAYDYFEKDHLGNVRTVLTDQTDFTMYSATMETGVAAQEVALFSNVEETRAEKPSGYPEDQTTEENKFVAKLNAKAGGKKIGPSLVLRVMAGDTVQISAKAFYKSQGPTDNSGKTPVEDMVAGLVQAFGGSAGQNGSHASEAISNNTPFNADFYNNNYQRLKEKNNDNGQANRPKAYLNFVLFDDDFKLVEDNSGVRQVKESPDELQELGVEKMAIEESGFLYVYTSNESQQDVFFDNVVLGVNSGPLLEETHYYPYGLTIAGISINALKGTDYAKNRKEYNGIEHITDLDLNQYDAFFRTLDPQTGRWAQLDPKTESMEMWSPYASMYNNPIRYSDLLGDSSIAPNSGLVERVPYRDGDQTGLIINATEEERQNNPVGAAIRDFSHAGLTLFGLNAIDNFIANRFNPEKNDPLRILAEAGAVALATTRGEVVEGNRETGITELIIDGSKHPESAQHAQEAMDRGILGEGVVDRAGASARRRGNLRNVKTEKGKDRDEFPPAVLRPSGDVSVKNITSGDNRGAGSSLGHQQANVPDNTRVQIKVINLQIVKE